ncbi:MAG TPA: carboxypeptidase-like regulatory domain-containing protein [Candidatus Acidoferrum sp.]|nr:carboxypeptidase-like regulatory domain-containing protein [Candidatus Acidoferrum sp.]
MNRPKRIRFLGASVLLLTCAASLTAAQQAPPAAPAGPAQDSSSKEKPGKNKYSHLNDFLIRGTVFNEKALSFPDVELRFRKEGEKKYKWETRTNSRGEFAVRVPQGRNYEILVHVKGFSDQTRTVEAKGGGNEETLVFRMQPITGDAK